MADNNSTQAGAEHLCSALPFLAQEELGQISRYFRSCRLSQGQTLFEAGEPADHLYILVAGRVAVKQSTGFENRRQVIALLAPGALVGEGCLGEIRERTSAVTAIEDSELVFIENKDFLDLSVKNPVIAIAILKFALQISSKRLAQCSKRLAHIL